MPDRQEVRIIERKDIFMGSLARGPIGVYAEQDGVLYQMGVRRWSRDLEVEGLLRETRISWKQAKGPELDIPHYLRTDQVKLVDSDPGKEDDRIWNEVTADIKKMRGPIITREYLIKEGQDNGQK